MTHISNSVTPKIIASLLAGGVVVLRTDTIYGLIGLADNEATVQRIYTIKGRTPTKSPIVLIGSPSQLYDQYDDELVRQFSQYWPGKHTLVLPSRLAPTWIKRHNDSVGYRLPAHQLLQKVIAETGRIIAPSANPEGQPPAENIEQAVAYFGDAVDYYVDGGQVTDTAPSKIFQWLQPGWKQLR